MRGVDSKNINEAFEAFEKNVNKSLVKQHTIIELYDYDAASFFQQAGYNVALSFTIFETLQSSSNKNDSVRKRIQNIYQIAGEVCKLDEMKQLFPDKTYLIWDLSYKCYLNTKRLTDKIADDKINLMLVSISSKYNN